MDNFHIVSALCRQVVKDGVSDEALKQIERLHTTLKENGSEDEATVLKRLITKASTKNMISPSQVSLSKVSHLKGQPLTPNSKVPVDKESGSPLAKVIFPNELVDNQMPVLSESLSAAVGQLIKEWSNVEKLNKFGVSPSLSCLLFGLPGTGKTQLALYIAKLLSMPVVLAKLDGLVSSLLGTSARNITNLFNFASQHKCILLLDEFDAVAKARDDNQEVGEIKRIVNTLLQCIDERSKVGMSIAITNHEVLLDPAVWRRFDIRVYVPKPDLRARESIICRYLPPVELSDDKIKFLSVVTEDFCGSDIELLVNNFKRHVALSESDHRFFDIVKALLLINASTSSELVDTIKTGDEAKVMYLLNKKIGMSQREIGKIFKYSHSKVSRIINEVSN
ncbi:TPA: AAA family ATPase [Vibrio cholerae]